MLASLHLGAPPRCGCLSARTSAPGMAHRIPTRKPARVGQEGHASRARCFNRTHARCSRSRQCALQRQCSAPGTACRQIALPPERALR